MKTENYNDYIIKKFIETKFIFHSIRKEIMLDRLINTLIKDLEE